MNFFLIKKIKLVALILFIISTISLIGSILLHNFLVSFKVDYPILVMSDYQNAKAGENFKLICNKKNEYCFNEYFVKRSVTKNKDLLKCNKYNSKNFFSVNDEITSKSDKEIFIYNDKSRKPNLEYLNEKIYSNYLITNELNFSCIKNSPFLKEAYSIFPKFIEKLINLKLNLTLGTSNKILPFINGETSISNIVKRYPVNLIFKTCLYISAVLMFLYWNLYNKFFYIITKKKYHHFFVCGFLSAFFLFLHVFFLGMQFENKFMKTFQKLPIILFILNEFMSQFLLTKTIYKYKNILSNIVKKKIVYLKIIYIFMISFISIYMMYLFTTSKINSKTEYILEWNYFTGLLIYYLLSYLMWKKLTSNPSTAKNFTT